MAHTAHFIDDPDIGAPSDDFNHTIDDSALVSFLAAGTVLFASLVVGSSASLLLAGSDTLMAAILRGFLSLGMWTLGGFFVAAIAAITVAMLRRRNAG
jgi:hypothetical protein